MSIYFDDLNNLQVYKEDQVIHVNQSDQDTSESVITIDGLGYPLILSFDNLVTFKCKLLKILRVPNLQITGLNLNGGIRIESSKVLMKFCNISNPQKDVDYLLSLTHADVAVENCQFFNTQLYGISVDSESNFEMNCSSIKKCKEANLIATGFSTVTITDSTISETESDLTISDNSKFKFTTVNFSLAKQSAIYLASQGSLEAVNCHFIDNQRGAVIVRQSTNVSLINCDILNSNDTSILLDNGSIKLDNVYVKKCNGNCINASAHSTAEVIDCHFEDSQWPLVAFCDNSSGIVRNSIFERSLMSGFIVRGCHNLTVDNCIIRSCAESGFRVTNSTDVILKNTCIGDAQYSSLEVCDLSKVTCQNCVIAGGARNGIGVFTGGILNATDCTILGPFNSAIWVHHGGSAFFNGLAYAPLPSPLKKGEWRIFANAVRALKRAAILDPIVMDDYNYNYAQITRDEHNDKLTTKTAPNDQRICRVDTKWAVEISNSYVLGIGNYELHANNLVQRHKTKDFPLAPCLVCGAKGLNSHFSPCGHALYCQKCWDDMLPEKRPETCPLCHLPIEKVIHHLFQASDDDKICAICYTQEVDCVIMPCGHTICHDCSNHWFKDSFECPFCREAQARSRPFVPYE